MADQRTVRGVSVATFIPAFALCIAHTAVTGRNLPAVGLIPLAFSSGLGVFLLSTGRARLQKRRQLVVGRPNDDAEARIDPDSEDDDGNGSGVHPFWLFLADTILATALMVVLVFTWMRISSRGYYWHDPRMTTLATYATVPLIVNFSIHAWLALLEFTAGVGLLDFIHYAMWHTVPPDCPHCGNRIRPDGLKTPPWFHSISIPTMSFREAGFSVPAIKVPGMSGAAGPRNWKAPAWMQGRPQANAPFFAEGSEVSHTPFHDEYDEDAAAVRPSVEVAQGSQGSQTSEGVEEVVVGKKDKGKETDVRA